MTITQTTQELLKAHAGRGFSSDPALTARHKVRLLQNARGICPSMGRAPQAFGDTGARRSSLHVQAARHCRLCLFGLGRENLGRQVG